MSCTVLSVFFLILVTDFSVNLACQVPYHKVGCYKDLTSSRAFPILLLNARDAYSDKNPGYSIIWSIEKYQEFLPRFICDCAKAALPNRYFSIQYYGECWTHGDSDQQDFTKYGLSRSCIDSAFRVCQRNSAICSGTQLTNMIYYIPTPTNTTTVLPIEVKTTHNPPPTTTKPPPISTKLPPTTTKPPPTTTKPPPKLPKTKCPTTTAKSHPITTKHPAPTTTKHQPTTTKPPPTTTKPPPTTTKPPPTTTKRPPTTTEKLQFPTTRAPLTTAKAPPTTTKAPPTTAKAPPTTTKAPPTTTKAPPTTTKAPPTTTKAPPTTTKAPPTTTKAPPTTTKAPPTTTKAPPSTAKSVPSTAATTAIVSNPALACSSKTDVLIAMDVSSSITLEEFEKRKTFLGEFVARFPVDDNQAHFALLHYNHFVYIDFTFNNSAFHNVRAIQKAITDIPLLGGATLTQEALKEASKLFSGGQHGSRENSRKVLVIVTDGYTYGGSITLRLPTLELELYGVQVVPVGIGNRINRDGLRTMSPKAIALDNILNKTDIELLEYLDMLTNAACTQS